MKNKLARLVTGEGRRLPTIISFYGVMIRMFFNDQYDKRLFRTATTLVREAEKSG